MIEPHYKERSVPYTYYQNVCTAGYSMVWWDWKRWEEEIDWMALNGINMPLAFVGQEYVWRKVFTEYFNLTEKDLEKYFSGPAFLPWNRMGNIRGWGGPLSDEWILLQHSLQMKILERLHSLDMIPVLPGFSGHVPEGIQAHFPTASISRSPNWGNFPDEYCCVYLLDSTDPLFLEIGSTFIRVQKEIYGLSEGKPHFYNVDTFNEMDPTSEELEYLKNSSSAVLESMIQGDSESVWVLQGWYKYWSNDRIGAYIAHIPEERIIILDLYSETNPLWQKTESYFGKPFIWNMLSNFGGNLGLSGRIDVISSEPFLAMENENCSIVGVGTTMEGINQNYVIYEMMSEIGWRKSIDVGDWVNKYAIRRYGYDVVTPVILEAWVILTEKVYSCKDPHRQGTPRSFLEFRPTLESDKRALGGTFIPCHDTSDIVAVLERLLESVSPDTNLTEIPNLKYDIVDVARQLLSDRFITARARLSAEFNHGSIRGVIKAGIELKKLIMDLDTLLATDEHFLLGKWIEAARRKSSSGSFSDLYEFNARNQITLWGPTGNIADYASKQWAGLVGGYYLKRWALFVETLIGNKITGRAFDAKDFAKKVFDEVESKFQNDFAQKFRTTELGNTFEMAEKVLSRYGAAVAEIE